MKQLTMLLNCAKNTSLKEITLLKVVIPRMQLSNKLKHSLTIWS